MEKFGMEINKEMFESLAKSAANTIEYFDGDERESMLKQLRDEVEKFCNMEEKIQCANQIKEHIKEAYNVDEGTDDERQNLVQEYKNKIAEIKPNPNANPNLIDFDRIVGCLQNDKDGKDGATEEVEDADLQLTRNTVNVICPVSKKRMTDPMLNTICNHVYDRDSVEALISVNSRTRCPVPGCKYKEYLSMGNMKSDIVTKTYLLKHPEA